MFFTAIEPFKSYVVQLILTFDHVSRIPQYMAK